MGERVPAGRVRGDARFQKLHLLDAPVERGVRVLPALEGKLRLLLIADVQFGEALAGGDEGAEYGGYERDARQFVAEVGGVAGA